MRGASTIRVAVSGTGFWAVANHLPWLRDRPEVDLVGAYDPDSARLAEVCEQFAIPVAAESYEDLIGLTPEAVVIASPPAFHPAQVEAALHAGIHVLCEKPFTIEPTDAWHLVELARTVDRALIVAYGWNRQPIVETGRRLLQEVGVGRIEQIVVHMASYVRAVLSSRDQRAEGYAPNPTTYTKPAISGGGYAPAQLTHAIGLVLYLTDDHAAQVVALTSGSDDIDLHDAAVLRYQSGAIGTITGASCWPPRAAIAEGQPWPPHQVSIRLYGTDGQFCLDLERDEVWIRREREDIYERARFPQGAGAYQCSGPLEALLAAVAGDLTPTRPLRAQLGAHSVDIVDAMLRSAEQGRPISIRPMADTTHHPGSLSW